MSKRYSDQEWLAMIQECRTSGLTDLNWLSMHPEINRATFYRHIRKLRNQACKIPSGISSRVPAIQEVVAFDLQSLPKAGQPGSISDSVGFTTTHENVPVCDQVVIQLEYHGLHMGITNAASDSTIAHAIAALQKLC